MPITVRLTNTARQPVTAYLQGRPIAFDIVVTRPDGSPVWRRLHGAVITSILQVRLLDPGETIEFADTWRQLNNDGQPVPPGEYLVMGVLPTDPPAEMRTARVPLTVLP